MAPGAQQLHLLQQAHMQEELLVICTEPQLLPVKSARPRIHLHLAPRTVFDEEATAKMLGELGEGESAAEGIPQELAHDLIHLMAHQKMIVETQHILSRCHTDDAMVVVGSDVKLRLDILAIDEALENALLKHDPNDPSKHFECLLERFDLLVSAGLVYGLSSHEVLSESKQRGYNEDYRQRQGACGGSCTSTTEVVVAVSLCASASYKLRCIAREGVRAFIVSVISLA